jgi:hypothetical protein
MNILGTVAASRSTMLSQAGEPEALQDGGVKAAGWGCEGCRMPLLHGLESSWHPSGLLNSSMSP